MQKIREGLAWIYAPVGEKISKELPVFYNPVMEANRTISVAVLNSLPNRDMRMCLPLAATGVRGIRFLRELKKGKVKEMWINDLSPDACRTIRKNLKLNKVNKKSIHVSQKEASLMILEGSGFDYIDIDPFGTPNPFLDAAVRRVSRGGILAVTATDTSALAGAYPDACRRKYWAEPADSELRHEVGVRILARKVQLVGAQYAKALTPIYSYSSEHYMRIFFSCEKGKQKVDSIIAQQGMLGTAGPMWTGALWDVLLAGKVASAFESGMTRMIAEESHINSVGFYDIHKMFKGGKTASMPGMEWIMKSIRKEGFSASRTHFSPTGIRSNISEKGLKSILRK